MMVVDCLKQRDIRWSALPLGTQGRTVGSHGCLLVSITAGLRNHAITDDVPTVLSKLNAAGAIAPSGDLDWTLVPKAYPQLHFVGRFYTVNDSPNLANRLDAKGLMQKLRKLNHAGLPVFLHVDAVSGDRIPDHFVALQDFDTMTVMDPVYGDLAPLTKRYGPPEKAIYGFGVFLGPPIDGPVGGDISKGLSAWKIAEAQSDMKNKAFYLTEARDGLIM